MNIKEEVIKILEEKRGTHISGADIAKKLEVSRNSIWKTIKTLTSEGYQIEAISNKGYALSNDNDIISSASISKYLDKETIIKEIKVIKSIDSTNDYAKDFAIKEDSQGILIVALEQTKGKGRMGRSFYSPSDSGIYMSLILKPKIQVDKAVMITTIAAVSLVNAIKKVLDKEALIKWVNDIYINDKKVAGILTEASLDFETQTLNYAILGMGVNITTPKAGFPKELENIADSILENKEYSPDTKSRFVAEIINEFDYYYKHIDKSIHMEEYIKKSLLIGKDIFYKKQGEIIKAKVLEVTKDAGLLVEKEDKTTQELNSGEVSLNIFDN